MDPCELDSQLIQTATRTLDSGLGSSAAVAALPQGAHSLDSWQNAHYGGVLFWLDPDLNVHGWGTAVLHDVMLQRDGQSWRVRGASGTGTQTAEEVAAEKVPGLHALGTTSQDPVRLVLAFASPEVSVIELRSASGTAARQPGVNGFCLIGITHSDPITYAHALDKDGKSLGGEPLLL